MGFGKCHLFFDCDIMKFFIISLFLLLLFDSPQGSSLPHRRSIRALNTTLQTNFNGTYERRNPCTNAEIETSSYVASHEFRHHTKEDTWSDYSHKCSAIISGFLQAIGNLVRFNNQQHGIFNFHINTSISQKQDGHCDSYKQKSCSSLPTIIIEATDGEISPKSSVENQPLQTETPCERNAKQRKYSIIGQSSNEEGKIGEPVTSAPPPSKVYPSQRQENELSTMTASSQPSISASRGQNIFYSKDYPTTPQCQTTSISFRDTTPIYPQQILQNGDNLSNSDDVFLTAKQTSKNVPPFVSQFPGKGVATTDQTSPAVFNDIPMSTPTTCKPEQKPDFYGTSPTPIFKPDVPNAITFRPEDVSTTTDLFPTACEPSPPNTIENPSAAIAITYPDKLEPLNSISSSPMPFGGFNEGTGFNIPNSTPSEPFYSTQDFTRQTTNVNTEEQLIQNQYQPSLLDGQQPEIVDPRKRLYDGLCGRVPESQQSATSFTPANEIPTTGLFPNQADSLIPSRDPTALDRPLSYPQIPPSFVETAASRGPEFQRVSSFDNSNSPNEYSSQPPANLLNTRVPIPSEFPQTVIPADMNSFSLPPQSPNLREIENINTTPLPQPQDLPDPFANNNSPDSNSQTLTDPNNQNQGITSVSIRPEYDELSNQMPVTKPPQPSDDFLINTRPTTQYYGPTSTPRFPINYPASPVSPTMFPTDCDTNENTTPMPSEFLTTSPLQDQTTPRTPDASLAPELGFTDVPSPFNIKTQPTESEIFNENRPTILTPNQQFPTEEAYSTQNYNKFSPTMTTQRQSFFTPESQLNQTPFKTQQTLAQNNEQPYNTPVENAQAPINPTPISPTIPDLIIPPATDFPYPSPAFNSRNMPVPSAFQTITPKIQTPQSLLKSTTQNTEFLQTTSEHQTTENPEIAQFPLTTAIPSQYQTFTGPETQPSNDYTNENGVSDSTFNDQKTQNILDQPETQFTSIPPFNQFPSTASPEQQPTGKYEISQPPALLEPVVPTPFQPPIRPELQSADYLNNGNTQIPDANDFTQQPPNTYNQPEPQLTSNAPIGEIPTTLSPETQYSAGPTYGREILTTPGPLSQSSPDYTGFPDSTVYSQQTPNTFIQSEPQFTNNAQLGEIPSTMPPQLEYTETPGYGGETMTTLGPQSQFSPDYTGIPDSTLYTQQTPNTFIQPDSQLNNNEPFNQFQSTVPPDQQAMGRFDVPNFPASVEPGVSTPFQPQTGPGLQSPDYLGDGSTQVPELNVFNQQPPNTFNQPEPQQTSITPFGEFPTTLPPETQYSTDPAYGGEITTTSGPQSQSSEDYTGFPESTVYSQQTPNSFIQPESQLNVNEPFNQFPSTALPEQQATGKFDIPKFPASVEPGVSTPFQPPIRADFQSPDYPNDGTTQTPAFNGFTQQPPNIFNQPEPQLTSNAPFGEVPTTMPPQLEYTETPGYGGETMTTLGPQSQFSPDYTGIPDSTLYTQQTPNTFIQPDSQLNNNEPFNQFQSTAPPDQQAMGKFDVPNFPASVEPGVSTPPQPQAGSELQSPDYLGAQVPEPNVFNQQPPNTVNQPEPQQTSSIPFGEFPSTMPPQPEYTTAPAYGGDIVTMVGPQSQSSPDYTGFPDSTVYSQQTPNAFIQPETQFTGIPPFNQFPSTASPEQQPTGKYEIPQPPALLEPEVPSPFQTPIGPELQSVDYLNNGNTQIPDTTDFSQQPPNTYNQPEPQLTSSTPFGESPTTLSPETQYSVDPAYGGETTAAVEPQSQPSFGSPDSTVNKEIPYVGFQPEPQFSTQFPTTLSPELQPIADYEIPPPPTSAPAYEEEIMTTQLPTTPEFQPPLDYANQYDSNGETGIPPSSLINQNTPSPFLNPELQFPRKVSPDQFFSPVTQSDENMRLDKGSSPPEYLSSPVPDSAPEAFVPTPSSIGSQPVTDSPAPYSNQNFHYSTQTPLIDSILTTPYENQPQQRPDLSAQTSPDTFPTTLAPDYADQTNEKVPSFEPSAPIGYQGESNFPGLPPSATTTSFQSQQPYFFPDESQETFSSQPPMIPQTPYTSNQNLNDTLVQPSLPIFEDRRMLGQYPDIYSPAAPSQYQTTESAQFLDRSRKMVTDRPIVPDQPFGSFTTPGIDPSAETAYTGTPPNSFIPERSLKSDSLIYNQMEQRPSTMGPYTVDDFSGGKQTTFFPQPFSQDLNNKFPNEQPFSNPEFSDSDSAPNRYETASPEQSSNPPGQLSYETFPTTAIPNQELATDRNAMFIKPQIQPDESFASSNQFSNYGTTLPASDPTFENSAASSATSFMSLNEGQSQQGPNQFNEYPITIAPQPTVYEPTTYRTSQPQTTPPFNEQRPFYPSQAESVSPALLPEETPSAFIPAAAYAPESEPQPQENIPVEQFYNNGQTTQMPENTTPVQQPSIVYPMNYQPGRDTPQQLPYPGSGVTDLPSGPQLNDYNKEITSNQPMAEGSQYPNEMSNFNSLPESAITFPPVGPQSRMPQFIPEEPSAVSYVNGQATDSPKMQTDTYVSYSQTQSTSEPEPQSMISTSDNDQSLPSKFQPSYFTEPQTGTTLPYPNDRTGGFKPTFDASEQTPSDIPLQTTPSGLAENLTIKPNAFQNLDSTFTQPGNNNPFFDTSNLSTENIPSIPTISPGVQYSPQQQQPQLNGPSDVSYDQFPSTISPQFTPTYNGEPTSASDYPSLLPKPRTLSQPSLDYYTDVPTFDRNSENEHSLNGIDTRQSPVPQANGAFTGSPNFGETSAPTGEYQGPAPGTSILPVPQQNSEQNLKSQFVQENTPMYSTLEPQPQQPFDYTTEIPDYQTVGPGLNPNTFNSYPPFQPEAFANSGPPSAATLQPTYTNAPDQNTRTDFPLPGTQPQPQNAGQEYDPNFNTPTPTLGYTQMNNPPDLALGSSVPELTIDGITSPPYQTTNPTAASYQTFPIPATQPAEAQTNLNIEPNISISEPNESLPAQITAELTDNTPSQFQPSTTQFNDEGTTLAPEFEPTASMNYEQFPPSSSEIPISIQNQPMNEPQPNPFFETQQLDPRSQYTTSPGQQTDYPQSLTSQPQDQVPNRLSFNNQQKTPSNDQLLQQNLQPGPVFYDQYSSTAPPEYLNGAPVATSEYPAPEPQAPVLNYPPQVYNPERQAPQSGDIQPRVEGNPIINYSQPPSTLFTEQPPFERSGEIIPTTSQAVDSTMQPGYQIPGRGSDKPVPNEFDKSQTENFPNPQETFNGYQPTPEQYAYPESNLNSNTAGTQSDHTINIPPSFQQTTSSEILPQTQTPPFETYSDNNRRQTSGPLTPPQPPNFVPEQQTTESRPFAPFSTDAPLNYRPDFPVTDAPTDRQFSYSDTLLNNDNNRLGASPQGMTAPQPNGSAESSSYPDQFTQYNVRKRPDPQLAFGGTTTPQNLESKNDNEGPLPVNTSQRPELVQQRTAVGNPVSPNFADYDQGFPTQPSTLGDYGGTAQDFVPRDPTLTDRRFITEGPYDPRLRTTTQRETGSPLGFGFENSSQRFPPNSELSTYPPRQQNQHPNPLLQTMESQMPFPMHGFPQRTGASPFPDRVSLDPRSSPIPFSFKPQNQNEVSTIPSYYPGGGFERNFVTTQPSQSNTRVNTAQDVMNTPLPDSHALVSDLTPTPSNKPDRTTTGRFGYMSSPLRNPYMRSIG